MARISKGEKEFLSKSTKGQCDHLITEELKKMYNKQKKSDLDKYERQWILQVRNEKREEHHQNQWYQDFKVSPDRLEELRSLSFDEIRKRAAELTNTKE